MDVLHLSEKLPKNFISQLPELSGVSKVGNLASTAILELQFLKYIDTYRNLYYNEDLVSYSIIRYEKYWMPFLAKMSTKMIGDLDWAPPIDIHWVWHVHMLAPVQYNKDCTTISQRMLGHELRDLTELEKLRVKTKSKWEEMYPGVPFTVDLSHMKSHPEALEKEESDIKYDIKSAALR